MIHHFKYTLKALVKDRTLVFWTFAFPLLLGLFFKMAFANIEKEEVFQTMEVAIVDNDNYRSNISFQNALEGLSNGDHGVIFLHLLHKAEDQAKGLLQKKKIVGYLIFEENGPKIVVRQNGTYETILKNIIDEISTTLALMDTVVENKFQHSEYVEETSYEELYARALQIVQDEKVTITDTSKRNLSYMMIEFYTLIAMSCLYGGIIAMEAIHRVLANMTSIGKRSSVSPLSKYQLILGSLLASYLIELLGIFLLLAFSYWILNVEFGSHFFLVLLLSMIGTLAGLMLGLAVAIFFKVGENTKVGLIIAISMVCSFFSGMMGVTMKYVVDKNIPLLNRMNPANMITDAFYSLYYYQELDRYFGNLGSLILFILVLFLFSSIWLRRQKYDRV